LAMKFPMNRRKSSRASAMSSSTSKTFSRSKPLRLQ
jgi:hypothetical protein